MVKHLRSRYSRVVKKQLIAVYGKEVIDSYEKQYGEEGILELARRSAKEGVCFTTPVFDGADFEKDILPLVEATAWIATRIL